METPPELPEISGRGPVVGTIGVTAVIVAHVRALETARPDAVLHDPLAERLVAGSQMPHVAQATLSDVTSVEALRRVYDAVISRTVFLDEHVDAALRGGCTQVVLLAAGLDARAFRLRQPADVFEVDFPNLFAIKEPAVAGHPLPEGVHRVCVEADLTDTTWLRRLQASGFRPSEPTVWIAEGIHMYLSAAENDQLLTDLTGLSAKGSRFLLVANGPGWLNDGQSKVIDQAAQQQGFGFKSVLDEPDTWLTSNGWQVLEASPLEDVSYRLGRREAPAGDEPPKSWAVAAQR